MLSKVVWSKITLLEKQQLCVLWLTGVYIVYILLLELFYFLLVSATKVFLL